MKTSMERLEKWLSAHLPELHDDLAPGCAEDALAAFERQVGRTFPDDLKALYRLHDGQTGAVNTGPFFGLTFLPLAQAQAHWASWKALVDEYSVEEMKQASEFCKSAKPGAVKDVYASPYWIPFAYDYGGNHLGVDLDPAARGTLGQVINFGRDEEERFVLAGSMGDFFEWLVDQLEAGNAAIRVEDDGGRSLNTKVPEQFHFLDSVASLFASQRND